MRWIDAVLFTHAHADHLHGIDDLRSVNRLIRRPPPIYADAQTLPRSGRASAIFSRRLAGRQDGFYKPRSSRTRSPGRSPRRASGGAVRSGSRLLDDARLSPRPLRLFDRRVGLDAAAFARSRASRSGSSISSPRAARDPFPSGATLDWIARVKPRRAILTHMDQAWIMTGAAVPAGSSPARTGWWSNC